MTGRWEDIETNTEGVQELVKEIPYNVPGFADLEIVKVVRAQIQVVSGLKYALTIQTRPKFIGGPATQECTLTVWIQPWLGRRVLLGLDCKPIVQPPLLGGWREGEIDDAVRYAADFGMSEINKKCNCFYMKLVYKINSVKKKVVAGMMYKINVSLLETLCRNTENNYGKSLQECGINPTGILKQCDITVLSQRWNTPGLKLIEHNCH